MSVLDQVVVGQIGIGQYYLKCIKKKYEYKANIASNHTSMVSYLIPIHISLLIPGHSSIVCIKLTLPLENVIVIMLVWGWVLQLSSSFENPHPKIIQLLMGMSSLPWGKLKHIFHPSIIPNPKARNPQRRALHFL